MKRFVLIIMVIVTIIVLHSCLQVALFHILMKWKEYANISSFIMF